MPNGSVEALINANRTVRADELALGEIIFNNQEIASGSYSCARCHVAGASYGQAWQPFARLQKGSLGPDLTGVQDIATEQQHFDLVWNGMKPGIGYFSRKQGNPQMPAFGLNPNTGQSEQGHPGQGRDEHAGARAGLGGHHLRAQPLQRFDREDASRRDLCVPDLRRPK